LSVSDSTGPVYGDIGQDTIDTILVSNGTYTVFGGTGPVDPGDGKDVIIVSDTNATIYGNGGNDTIEFADSAVTVYAGTATTLSKATRPRGTATAKPRSASPAMAATTP
jgi:hypothetical protein